MTFCELLAGIVLSGAPIEGWLDFMDEMVDEIDAMVFGCEYRT